MKLNGKPLRGPATYTLVLPRGDEETIVVQARAVPSYDEFHKVYPMPQPPNKIIRGGARMPDFEHPEYKGQMNDYGKKKTSWMILKSLQATEGWEWETVDMSDPTTWDGYEKELEEAGFADIERQRILGLVIDANCLNEKRLEEAREAFLSGRLQSTLLNGSVSQQDEAKNTPSGEPAKELVSASQAS